MLLLDEPTNHLTPDIAWLQKHLIEYKGDPDRHP